MQEKKETLRTPIRYFKGVGPRRGEDLAEIGVHTVADLLYYSPKRYEDRSKISAINDVRIGEYETIHATVTSCSSRRTRRGLFLFQIAVKDASGTMRVVWFNQPYLRGIFKPGQRVILYGKVELQKKLQMNHPEYEIIEGGEDASLHVGRIVPIYSLSGQLTQRHVRTLADQAVKKFSSLLNDNIPTQIRARERLVDIKFAIENIHYPASFENLKKAYKRLVFEEFFFLQLAFAVKKKRVDTIVSGIRHSVRGALIADFRRRLPFSLTEGQKNALCEIENDMASTRPMNRLLVGDVGSGKTIVAAHALLISVQNGFQGVLMAPTEVLARQHYIELSKLVMPLGINVALLAQGIPIKKKERIYKGIREGAINIVVGTHAVIQETVRFNSVGLIVIDEQHKFGVTQRALLKEKGKIPHTLFMTATPIPRTLALTVYGDLDVSTIKDMPSGRRPVATYWVEEEKRDEVYSFIKEEVRKGRQAYIVYPLIEKSEHIESKSAAEMHGHLKNDIFSGCSVGLLHGKMRPQEKDSVMKEFKKGKISILVSTVVIEVGIDVANATCMVIENAERFGLSQLHQLRGRIGRGIHDSFCILLANPQTDAARKRLKSIEDTIDGFQIAEEDLRLRGPGEFFGTRQHGLPEIRFGDIVKDFDIMEAARKEAFALIQNDPHLGDSRLRYMREELARRYRQKIDIGKVD